MIPVNQNALALLAIAAAMLIPPAALARQANVDETTTSIVVHTDLHPQSPEAAQASLARIGEAAVAACGASPFSLREIKASVRTSGCWRDAMQTTLAKIGDSTLLDAYVNGQRKHGAP